MDGTEWEGRGSQQPSPHSASASLREYRMLRRSTGSNSSFVARADDREVIPEDGTITPPFLSSPSAASSLVFSSGVSPVRPEAPTSAARNEGPASGRSSRLGLARRLSQLAKQLTDGDEMDELAMGDQLDLMERTMTRSSSQAGDQDATIDTMHKRSRSDLDWSLVNSPQSSFVRSRHSDQSASQMSAHKEPEAEASSEKESEAPLSKSLTIRQANKVIAEVNKLNDELLVVVENLKARQEESDHIHTLLIERAERAAQRIIFLQDRISYLEQELQDNDDELQHLRICLKAVEIQLPPHPDRELQRCIAVFKEDYKALKERRAERASQAGYDSVYNNNNNESTLAE